MRIFPWERRLIERRLRHRLPPILQLGRKIFPQLVLLVSISVSISPEALAKLQDEKSDIQFTKIYSKEELSKKMPENPVVGLDSALTGRISSFFKSLTQKQNKDNQRLLEIQGAATLPREEDYMLQIAASKREGAPKEVNRAEISKHLSANVEQTMGEQLKDNSLILQKLSQGFAFDLDFSSLFKGSEPQSRGEIRYGLVVQDIVPSRKAKGRAAINSNAEDEMKYAGKADVVWTIGPLHDDSSRKIFNFNTSIEKESSGLLSRIKMPKLKFGGKAEPADPASFVAQSKSGIPSMKFSLAQEEEYYKLVYQTKQNMEKDFVEHHTRIPVYGNFSLGRRFDDKFRLIETSYNNILIDQRAPLISVHYMHMEDRYIGEMVKNIKDGELKLKAEMSQGWHGEKSPGQSGEKYSLEVKKDLK